MNHGQESEATGPRGNPGLKFLGADEAGIEVEVIALPVGDDLIVIHAMPTNWRK